MKVGKLSPYIDLDTGRSVPLCRDCEHVRHYANRIVCAHPSSRPAAGEHFSPVTGELYGKSASVARTSTDLAHCGPTGKHFEREVPASLPPVQIDSGPGIFGEPWVYLVVVSVIVACTVQHCCGGAR
jgi:hypothetical protein